MTSKSTGNASVTPLRPTKPCPICGQPSVRALHPFCSARCADIDLNRWLSGAYVIPARPDDEDDNEGAANDIDYDEDPF